MMTVRSYSVVVVLLASLIVLPWGSPHIARAAEDLSQVEVAERLYKAGKWYEAGVAYQKLVPLQTADVQADSLRKLAYCLERQSDFEGACDRLREGLAVDGAEPATKAVIRLRLGYCLRRLGQGREAIEVLEQAAVDPAASSTVAAEALLYGAWEHGVQEQWDEALSKFRRVENVPDVHANYTATARLSVGKILQKRQQYEQAIEVYRSIADLNPVAATNRARARVYRLECEALLAGDVAFHIRPYVSHVHTRGARIFWVSQGDVEPGEVQVFAADATDSEPQTLAPQLRPLKDTACQLHVVEVADLKPGLTYRYEVRCGGETQTGSFPTAPVDGRPFAFCVIGDTQSYHPALQPLLNAMGEEDSDFVLHVGDITDRGNLWGEWKACFFDPGHSYLKDSAFWPAFGNHDGGPYFPALFDHPKKLYYSFDYGNAHFIVLDSYGAGTGGVGRQQQLKWLKGDLEANQKSWTFVTLHVPMVATRRSLEWFGADDFLPLLEQYQVDIVFSGHHPHYRRYYPIGAPGKRPVLHVTSGGGGGPVGGALPSPLLAEGINVNHYCKIRIDGDQLELTAHAISGSVIDRFQITKDPQQLLLSTRENSSAGRPVSSADARKIISLYEELLTDRTLELVLEVQRPIEPGRPVQLVLDLKSLPRGPLDPKQFAENMRLEICSAEGDPWQIQSKQALLSRGRILLEATAPPEASGAAGRHAAKIKLQFIDGEASFAPYLTTARLVPAGGE